MSYVFDVMLTMSLCVMLLCCILFTEANSENQLLIGILIRTMDLICLH